MKKLENLISFDDFNSNWNKKHTKTKRTETGLDILKENVEEIIPEELPEDWDGSIGAEDPNSDARFYPDKNYKSYDDKVNDIINFVENGLNEDAEDAIVNELRDALLEMEQQGFVDENTTDDLDDEYDGDWAGWIKAVVQLPDFPEEGLNNVLEIINNSDYSDEFSQEDDIEDIDDMEDM